MAEESTTSRTSRTSADSRGGVGCCGCCAAVTALILIATALATLQFLSWGRDLWLSLDSDQRVGMLIVAALTALAALVVIWRARPRVTTHTRFVTTRVISRRQRSDAGTEESGSELPAEWRPAIPRPDAEDGGEDEMDGN